MGTEDRLSRLVRAELTTLEATLQAESFGSAYENAADVAAADAALAAELAGPDELTVAFQSLERLEFTNSFDQSPAGATTGAPREATSNANPGARGPVDPEIARGAALWGGGQAVEPAVGSPSRAEPVTTPARDPRATSSGNAASFIKPTNTPTIAETKEHAQRSQLPPNPEASGAAQPIRRATTRSPRTAPWSREVREAYATLALPLGATQTAVDAQVDALNRRLDELAQRPELQEAARSERARIQAAEAVLKTLPPKA